jgi:hypothetical protein
LITADDFSNLLAEINGADNEQDGFEIIKGRLCYYGAPLINCAPRITHELTQDDGLNPPAILFTLSGVLASDEPLESIEISAADFESMKWITSRWGARAIIYIKPGQLYQLRRAIQEVSLADLVRERVYTFTGWTKVEGQPVYLTTSGALGAEGLNPAIRVDLGPNNMRHYALPAPAADPRPAIEASLRFLDLAPAEVSIPLV